MTITNENDLHVMNLKKIDEFKDLSINQLYKIQELILNSKLNNSEQEEQISDLQDEIDDLEQKLEDADYEYDRLSRKYDELDEAFNNIKDKYNELKNVNNTSK